MGKAEKRVNLAVIGAGYWGRKVVREYLNLEKEDSDFRLVEVCDLLESNLDYCKKELDINPAKLTTDYESVFKSLDIDAVHICTPNETHYKFGSQALNEGKNVLLEKPIALSPKDAWDLCRLSESKRLCLQVGHIYRFNNALKKVRDLISEGYFGDLYYFKLQWTTWMPSPLGRDIIFDLGPHPVDILHFLIQKWPKKVNCTANYYRRPSLEEVAYINLDFGHKLMANVELSWLQPGKVREVTIIGSKRAAKVDCLDQTVHTYEDNNGENFSIEIDANNTIFDEVKNFIFSIRDETNHKNPGAVGAGNVVVLDSLKRSLEQEKSVKVGLDN